MFGSDCYGSHIFFIVFAYIITFLVVSKLHDDNLYINKGIKPGMSKIPKVYPYL